MRPDRAERRPRQESDVLENRAGGDDSTKSVPPGSVISPYRQAERWRGWIGCWCGCESRPPWVIDPECKARRPLVPVAEYGARYDAVTLGLAPHDRDLCEHCRAVGA